MALNHTFSSPVVYVNLFIFLYLTHRVVFRLGADVPVSELLYDDLCDDDPRRDIKDVAFAQAYLEKVCWVNAYEKA